MKLYDSDLSGNSYKIRLLLSLIGVSYEKVPVDLPQGGTLTPEFKRMNPRGQVPVLEDAGEIIWDSQAILVYVARRYGSEQWLPTDALGEAKVMQWLAVAENELLYGLGRARAALKYGRPYNVEDSQKTGRAGLEVLDGHLTDREWLAAAHPTIADVACYPYSALAPQGDVPLDPYPNVCAWLTRIQALPGYVGTPGLWQARA